MHRSMRKSGDSDSFKNSGSRSVEVCHMRAIHSSDGQLMLAMRDMSIVSEGIHRYLRKGKVVGGWLSVSVNFHQNIGQSCTKITLNEPPKILEAEVNVKLTSVSLTLRIIYFAARYVLTLSSRRRLRSRGDRG